MWSAASAITGGELSQLEQLETIRGPLRQPELRRAACAGAAIWNAQKTERFIAVSVHIRFIFAIWIVGLLLGVLIKQFLLFALILNLSKVAPLSTVPIARFTWAVPLSNTRDPTEAELRDEKRLLTSTPAVGSVPAVRRNAQKELCRDKRTCVPSGKFLGARRGDRRKEKQDQYVKCH